MASSGSLTYDDLATFPDDGLRRELIDGELFVSPSPVTRHQVVLLRLALAFGNYFNEHGGGQVFIARLDVLFSDKDVVEPDLIVVADADRRIIGEKNIRGTPTLVIEVVSKPHYDRVRKRALYARFGVPIYVIADPDADRIEVYLLEGDRYLKPVILEAGDVLELPMFPGFRLDIAELFTR